MDFEAVKMFMQSHDRNGDWENATPDEAGYIKETLEEWVADGLEVSPRQLNAIMSILNEIA